MIFHVGTSGFAIKEWKGPFYPEDIHPDQMLKFYGERLNAVEINYTFYHMPTQRVLAPWAEEVPKDFVFAFKAPRVITHIKRLKDVGEEIDYLFKTLAMLEHRLGAVLFQFPANFKANRQRLEDLLKLIPQEARCAFEFRSPTWMEPWTLELLRDRDFCLCMADTDEAPVDEITSTASWGYLRMRRGDYSRADLAAWLGKIQATRWQKAFVFFKHEDEAKGPREALDFVALSSQNPKKFTP